jgi:hypothetical protein
MAALLALNGGTVPAWVSMSSAALATIPTGPQLLGPTQLVKSATSPVVYMVDGLTKKVPLASFTTAAEFGVKGYSTYADSVLSPFTTASGSLSLVVSCGSQYFVAGSGMLWRLTVNQGSGLPVTVLDPVTCAALAQAPSPITTTELFLRSPTSGEIYVVRSGAKSFVSSMAALLALNGGTVPAWVSMSSAALATIPTGPQVN